MRAYWLGGVKGPCCPSKRSREPWKEDLLLPLHGSSSSDVQRWINCRRYCSSSSHPQHGPRQSTKQAQHSTTMIVPTGAVGSTAIGLVSCRFPQPDASSPKVFLSVRYTVNAVRSGFSGYSERYYQRRRRRDVLTDWIRPCSQNQISLRNVALHGQRLSTVFFAVIKTTTCGQNEPSKTWLTTFVQRPD